jgi:hypothetical protein
VLSGRAFTPEPAEGQEAEKGGITMDDDNVVATIDYSPACLLCKHYRPEKGGCDPLDESGAGILTIDMIYEVVRCEKFMDEHK